MVDWEYLAMLDRYNIKIIGIEFNYDFNDRSWAN